MSVIVVAGHEFVVDKDYEALRLELRDACHGNGMVHVETPDGPLSVQARAVQILWPGSGARRRVAPEAQPR
jgi:hypothetical protein